MGLRMTVCAAAVMAAAFGFGCGGDDGSEADASPADAMLPDAGFNEAACPSAYGPAAVASTFVIPAGTVGFDLDNDAQVDNLLGENETLRALINNNLSNSIRDGSFRSVNELRGLGAIGTDDNDVDVVLFGGVDSDDPAVLTDDFNGDEDYYYDRVWVTPEDCGPVGILSGTYSGGVVSATNDATTFFISSLGGFVEFRRARIEATIEADTKGFKTQAATKALFAGAIPSCALNAAPGTISLKAQEDLARVFMVQPDIDLDGDGLETVQAVTGDGIVSCTDGDGTTVIMGEDCGCDPRMADAYSITFEIDLVGAAVLGPVAE